MDNTNKNTKQVSILDNLGEISTQLSDFASKDVSREGIP